MSRNQQQMRENRNPAGSSIYPLHPGQTLIRIPDSEMNLSDRMVVIASSLLIVGSIAWIPIVYAWAWKKYRSIKSTDRKRRALYLSLILGSIVLLYKGPHKRPRVGEWLRVRKWKLWNSWLRFIAMEVISDQNDDDNQDHDDSPQLLQKQRALLAFVPHGIFPFALAFGALPERAKQAFGVFRPVTATAVNALPLLGVFLSWLNQVDASKIFVSRALARGDRLGIIPGGISEIFEGYPKKGTRPDEEYAIVRQGFLRLALQHGVPVIPIYCFGSTKMFKRFDYPVLERLSSMIRVSIVLFFGVAGLPIPFRQKLLYVMGRPIVPPSSEQSGETTVQEMHQQFCDELIRIFDRHKEAYGWGHKSLQILSK